MKIKDIATALEELAPLAYQESYDNCGLLVGEANAAVKGILVTLDVTEAVIDEAVRERCNLVIAHHPLIFSGLKKITGRNQVERAVIKAIKKDVAIYAIHTNLDNVSQGVNKRICDVLGLLKPEILQPKQNILKKLYTFVPLEHFSRVQQALFDAGAGHIGNYSDAGFSHTGIGTFKGNEHSNPKIGKKGQRESVEEVKFEVIFPSYLESGIIEALKSSHPYEEVAYDVVSLNNRLNSVGSGMVGILPKQVSELDFLRTIKRKLKSGAIKYTALTGKPVSKVAVCGGAGKFLLQDAIKAGAQIFISSDFKYHDFFEAEGKIVVVDAGHYETEQFTSHLLHDYLLEKFPIIAPRLSKTITNPINYL